MTSERKRITSIRDSEEFPTDAQMKTITKLEMANRMEETYFKGNRSQAARYIARLIDKLNVKRLEKKLKK